MSQHDYVIDDQTGLDFLVDLNNVLAAIISNNSGATAPGTTYAYQWWADTTGVLKQRNAANSAWVEVCSLADWALHSVQLQKSVAFTTAGTQPAYTVTTNPIITLATNQRFRLKFHSSNAGAASTLSKDGGATKSIKQYDSTGAKVNAQIVANALHDVEYDGTDFVILNPLPGAAATAGQVAAFAQNSAPTGWLKCNGAAVSRTTYNTLFAAIGTVFGVGDGSTTFNLPELRGEFIRGWDDSRGIDSGRAFGSAQSSQMQSHSHTWGVSFNSGGGGTYPAVVGNSDNSLSASYSTSGQGGTSNSSENRPRSIALLYCIKF